MKLSLPLSDQTIKSLHAGDIVYLSGTIYTGRDQAHKRIINKMSLNRDFPLFLKGETIYYVGPTPKRNHLPIGSAGPTSSYRMDQFSIPLMRYGLKVMIGKGNRSKEFKDVLLETGSIYLTAIGGTAAKISSSIISSEVIEFDDLGPEAIHKLEVKDFPAIVIYDTFGNDLYEMNKEKYKKA